jgi:hypothetical protein
LLLLQPEAATKSAPRSVEFRTKPEPVETPVFARMNAVLGAEHKVDGILGNDFLARFDEVCIDHRKHTVTFRKN